MGEKAWPGQLGEDLGIDKRGHDKIVYTGGGGAGLNLSLLYGSSIY